MITTSAADDPKSDNAPVPANHSLAIKAALIFSVFLVAVGIVGAITFWPKWGGTFIGVGSLGLIGLTMVFAATSPAQKAGIWAGLFWISPVVIASIINANIVQTDWSAAQVTTGFTFGVFTVCLIIFLTPSFVVGFNAVQMRRSGAKLFDDFPLSCLWEDDSNRGWWAPSVIGIFSLAAFSACWASGFLGFFPNLALQASLGYSSTLLVSFGIYAGKRTVSRFLIPATTVVVLMAAPLTLARGLFDLNYASQLSAVAGRAMGARLGIGGTITALVCIAVAIWLSNRLYPASPGRSSEEETEQTPDAPVEVSQPAE